MKANFLVLLAVLVVASWFAAANPQEGHPGEFESIKSQVILLLVLSYFCSGPPCLSPTEGPFEYQVSG
jgi:hypothetical protein